MAIFDQGTSIIDVPSFAFLTYLLYNVLFLGLYWTILPTPILDVINGRSLTFSPESNNNLYIDGPSKSRSTPSPMQFQPAGLG